MTWRSQRMPQIELGDLLALAEVMHPEALTITRRVAGLSGETIDLASSRLPFPLLRVCLFFAGHDD